MVKRGKSNRLAVLLVNFIWLGLKKRVKMNKLLESSSSSEEESAFVHQPTSRLKRRIVSNSPSKESEFDSCFQSQESPSDTDSEDSELNQFDQSEDYCFICKCKINHFFIYIFFYLFKAFHFIFSSLLIFRINIFIYFNN